MPGLIRNEDALNGIFWADWEPKTDMDALDVFFRSLRNMVNVQRPVEVIPVTLGMAKVFIEHVHRHLPKIHAWKYGVGLQDPVSLVGVVVVGRPVARALDDGQTLEIVRCCLLENIAKNAASMLLGRACRIGKDMGFSRMITYTLPEEAGTSLRASGFQEDGKTKGGQWNCESRPRRTRGDVEASAKTRWMRELK